MGKRQRPISKEYWLFASLRFILTLIPQTGYIHPDEFFQNVEVLAGRTFNYEVSLPWEFNVTNPIRSIGVSSFTIGFSYQILKLVSAFLPFAILSPYSILIAPRIFICLLTYIVDYVIYQICLKNNEKSYSRLYVLSTSYVMLVYCTRTFSNTLEVILFALLLYYVAESMIFSNIVIRQREYINNRYNRTENPADRAKFHKLRMFLASDSYRNCLQISTLSVLGFFNRPTFLAYALFPIFFWLYRGIGYKSVNTLQFNLRIFALVLTAIPTIAVIIIIDSFFYGYLTWGEIGMMDVSINNFVFAPWNFIKYNIDSKNLAVHGLHPRYLHILVNVPLLFNFLGVFSILGAMDITKKLLQRKYNLLPTVRSIKGLMTMSYIGPTLFLSLFPHQEPRFLVPIVIPLVYLFANQVCDDKEVELVKAQPKANMSKDNISNGLQNTMNTQKSNNTTTNALMKLWIALNFILTLFYGFVHQGGVTTAASALAYDMQHNHHYNYHIVTSHIYSIPHVLFMQPNVDQLIMTHGSTKYKMNKRLFTYEEGSKNLTQLIAKINKIGQIAADNRRRYKLYLLLTGSKHKELLIYENSGRLHFKHIKSFYPHISFEAPPDFSEVLHILSAVDVKNIQFSQLITSLKELYQSFDLKLYEVQFV